MLMDPDHRTPKWQSRPNATQTSQLSEQICRRIADAVISELQEMRDALVSGDDSGLRNTWEEICDQIQFGESIYWSIYDDVVRAIVDRMVADIGPDERRAIWLQTPAGIDWRCEDDAADVSEAVSSEDIDDYIQREYVYRIASDWPLHGA